MNHALLAVTKLALAFPHPAIDPRTIQVYAEQLDSVDPALLKRACELEMRSSEHFPRICAILKRVAALKTENRLRIEAQERRKLLEEPKNPMPDDLLKQWPRP